MSKIKKDQVYALKPIKKDKEYDLKTPNKSRVCVKISKNKKI